MRVMDTAALRVAGRRVGVVTLLGVVPTALLVSFVVGATVTPVRPGSVHAIDFHTFWVAARTYASGDSPYPQEGSLAVWAPSVQQSFVYPAPTIAALAPFGFLPYSVAVLVFVPLLACAIGVSLWLLGVRDWRCYGATFASPAVLTGISVGTLSPLLMLGVAVAWRWRERRGVVGLAVGAVVLAKLFMWPLLIWLWFSGRRRAAVIAAGAAAVATVGAWSWIGLTGVTSYPSVLRRLSLTEGPHTYAPLWLTGSSPSFWIASVFGGAIVAVVARRRRDALPFALAILVALLVTPILWLHYLVLVAAVVAVLEPKFGVAWLLPLAAWVTAQQGAFGEAWRTLAIVLLLVLTFGSAALEARHGRWRDEDRVATRLRWSQGA